MSKAMELADRLVDRLSKYKAPSPERGFTNECIEELRRLAAVEAERDALKAENAFLEEMNAQLREQNDSLDKACAEYEAERDRDIVRRRWLGLVQRAPFDERLEMSKWEELEKAARAATPGPWITMEVGDFEEHFAVADAEGVSILTVVEEGNATFGAIYSDDDATYIAAANPSVILELLAERDALAAKVNEMIDSECDKIMAMSDNQISAMLRQDGRNPDDVATIGKQAAQLAVIAVKLSQLEAERDALKAELDRINSLEPVGWQGQETFHFFPDTVSPTAWRTLRDDELDLWRSKVAELPHRYVIRPIYTLEKP